MLILVLATAGDFECNQVHTGNQNTPETVLHTNNDNKVITSAFAWNGAIHNSSPLLRQLEDAERITAGCPRPS